MKPIYRTLIWVTLFSIAMAYLESAVVVYLRAMFYEGGFGFPLQSIEHNIAYVEFWREVATIVMLLGIGWVAGRTPAQRFAGFIYSFAVWDIFYYVFLKVLLDWPATIVDWDVLFLVPVPWVGPVLTPLLVTVVMISLSASMVWFDLKGVKARLHLREWLLFVTGSLVVILSWVWDYLVHILDKGEQSIWTLSSQDLFTGAEDYIPQTFNWLVFFIGMAILLGGLTHYILRLRQALPPRPLRVVTA